MKDIVAELRALANGKDASTAPTVLVQGLFDALEEIERGRRLATEVGGSFEAFEGSIREVIGNTNYALIRDLARKLTPSSVNQT